MNPFQRLRSLLLVCISLPTLLIPPSAGYGQTGDYEVKAQLVYTLVPYIKWVNRTPNKPEAPTICTIGLDSVHKSLQEIKAKEHSAVDIVKKSAKSDFSDCHILYVSSSEIEQVADLLRKVGNKDVLTVSSIPGFAAAGGCVEFVSERKGVTILINKRPVETNQIFIDGDLLGVSDTIYK